MQAEEPCDFVFSKMPPSSHLALDAGLHISFPESGPQRDVTLVDQPFRV
jgi:hypothetical protein